MADEKPEVITPPNTLQGKVTVGGPGAVSAETLQRAEKVISDLADEYITWARDDLVKLQEAFANLEGAEGDHKEHLEKVFHVAHDMKGQGGSFGYDLITIVGNGLCRFLEKQVEINPGVIEAIQLHVNAMQVIIANDIKGDGGAVGEQLLDGLEQVVAKVTK